MITLKNKSKTDEKLKNYLFNLQTKLNDVSLKISLYTIFIIKKLPNIVISFKML